jgi:diaminopimelate epimerase
MTAGIDVLKMCGAGNDFVVLGPAAVSALPADLPGWVRRVCRRRISVGADGVLLVEPAGPDRVRVRFYNPDGSEAFCGNGSRCAARYARLHGLAGPSMVLDTAVGEVGAKLVGEEVRLTLPPPRDLGDASVRVGADLLTGRHVDAGVPHYVVFSDAPAEAPLERWGPAVRHDARFAPAGVNFDVAGPVEQGVLRVRTWERGVEGETLACGSGAVAAAFARRLLGAGQTLTVIPRSGIPLRVELPGPRDRPLGAVLAGDARIIFRGQIHPEAV